jgi:predicted ArsR family transcriptional regulator
MSSHHCPVLAVSASVPVLVMLKVRMVAGAAAGADVLVPFVVAV